MDKIKKYFLNIAIWLDQGFNVVFLFGDPDETISSVLGKRYVKSKTARILCHWISQVFREPKHCRKAIEEDEGGDAL